MLKREIVVIGTSSGGVEALTKIVGGLPKDFPATVLIVMHTSPHSPGYLPKILTRAGHLPVTHAEDLERISRGHIYVAPPDQHLLIEPRGYIRITRGPKENRFRPAIDPLFRSAALAFGPRVIGVILTGSLDDGTPGLKAIKRRGGLAIVQDPVEAAVDGRAVVLVGQHDDRDERLRAEEVEILGFIADAAVALIAFAAGTELKLQALRAHRLALGKIALAALAFPFAAVAVSSPPASRRWTRYCAPHTGTPWCRCAKRTVVWFSAWSTLSTRRSLGRNATGNTRRSFSTERATVTGAPAPDVSRRPVTNDGIPESLGLDPGDARLRAELEEILRAPELEKAFVGVHVRSQEGLTTPAREELEEHQRLLEQLGGRYREVAGDDIARVMLRCLDS